MDGLGTRLDPAFDARAPLALFIDKILLKFVVPVSDDWVSICSCRERGFVLVSNDHHLLPCSDRMSAQDLGFWGYYGG